MTRCGLFFLIVMMLEAGAEAAPRSATTTLPVVFEPAPDSRAFVARSADWSILIRGNETLFAAGARDRVRVRLAGSNSKFRVRGADLQSGRSNYLTGRDATRWRTNVAHYARVEAKEVYPGIDLIYYGHSGRLEHDFVVAPGADATRIRMEVEGARNVALNAQGDLVIRTGAGEITESKPEIYQLDERGQKLVVPGGFHVVKQKVTGRQIGIEVGSYDHTKPLIIDPVLTYGAYLGGTGDDISYSAALDSAGNVYIAGSTTSADFVTRNPLQTKGAGDVDAFVAKFSPTGTLIYSTYLGGSLEDRALGIAADSAGNAYVTGLTRSLDFPTTDHVFQRNTGGVIDAFVTKLNPSGSALVYSTYLGGQAEDIAHSIVIDSSGSAYVTGATASSGFPISASAPQKTFAGVSDAFLTKLDPAASVVVYSTFLGGSDAESGSAVAVDSNGSAYITGSTNSKNFPLAGPPLQAGPGGGVDAFFARMNPAGTAWVQAGVFGGTGDDTGYGIAADVSRAWIVGAVQAIKPMALPSGVLPPTPVPTFPTTTNAYQKTYGGGDSDAFAAVISGGALVYATLLGREGAESGQSAGLSAGSYWATVQNTGTLTPALGSNVPGNNPPSLCGGTTDSTTLLQFDLQFRPVSESCINFTQFGLALGVGARLVISGAASPADLFATSTPPPPPPPGTGGSSIVSFNGGSFDAAFQLLSTATPPANLESFFPLTLSGAPGPALAADFDGTGGANDVLASGANMASLTSMFNINAAGPVTVADTFITSPLASTPLMPTGSTIFKDAATGRNNFALAGIPSDSGQAGAGQILMGVNNGHGGFSALQPLVASPGVANLIHGDFNNDGFDDLGYIDFNNNAAAITLSDTQGGFKLPSFRDSGGLVAVSAVTADFDDDGNLDVAVLSQGTPVGPPLRFVQSGISLLRGQGDGTLQPVRELQVADLGLSMVGGLSDIEANGTRRMVDFNNDGFPDLAVAAVRSATSSFTSPIVMLMLNQPDNPGTFTAAPAQDVSGGVLAQAAARAPGEKAMLERAGAELGAGAVLAATSGVTREMPMAAADFDRDGNWDLAVLNPFSNTLSILKGDGHGGLTQAGTYLVGRNPISVSVADFNNDKMPDLVVANRDSRSVQVFLNRNPPPAVEVPEISAAGVANAASFQGGAVSPGEIVTIFGSGMGPAALAGLQLDASGKASTLVAGTRVLFDGVPAPIVYTSATQLSAIVPYSVVGKAHTVIQVEYQGRTSNRIARPVSLFRPALFTANSSGKGQGAILNQNGSVNSPSNPADKGSIVVLYATGEGQTNPPGVDGLVAGAVVPKPLFPARVKIGGADADVQYYGAAPGLVSGVLQVNAVIPPGTSSGSAVPVTISVGSVTSLAGTTLAVK